MAILANAAEGSDLPPAPASPFSDSLDPRLSAALEKKGFVELTSVQRAVLDPSAAGRDLRISSQTGSGKTVAIGLVIAALAEPQPLVPGQLAPRPRALVITPTRELARQVEEELRWLYASLGARVASVTGGRSFRDEFRALAVAPSVVVGTPGRLLDHLQRKSFDVSALGAVVLDEADRMLDMGFRDELEAILEKMPEGHRTHLVSATFPKEVERLANKVQSEPFRVEGTKLGAANVDIDHVVHLVDPAQTFDALVNLLLANPSKRTLVFAQTRLAVGDIAAALSHAGFAAASLSGDLEQRERTRALHAFRDGRVRVLVATDVAARGIDVEDIALVVQMEPPLDADTYTHRSGRTGRAGKRGTSALLVAPRGLAGAKRLLDRAKITFRIDPIPTRDVILRMNDERLVTSLTATDEDAGTEDPRLVALASRILASAPPERTVARMLARIQSRDEAEPRDVLVIVPPPPRSRPSRPGTTRGVAKGPTPERAAPRAHAAPREHGPREHEPREHVARERTPRVHPEGGYSRFLITWGALHGADPRRLLAMLCRRGGVDKGDIGAIDVGRTESTVQISNAVAERFAEAAGAHDPRDPRVRITPDEGPVRRPRTRDSRPTPHTPASESQEARASRRSQVGTSPSPFPPRGKERGTGAVRKGGERSVTSPRRRP